jgi:putative holliday junction resolvase
VRKPAVTFLGFDYGKIAIGVAVGSTQSGLAQDLATVKANTAGPDWDHISRLIQEWQPQALVVGLPMNMDDSANRMTQAAQQFGNRLSDRYNLPVHMVDERLTTIAARNALTERGVPARRHKTKLDRLAAKAILQAFLDERSTERER